MHFASHKCGYLWKIRKKKEYGHSSQLSSQKLLITSNPQQQSSPFPPFPDAYSQFNSIRNALLKSKQSHSAQSSSQKYL